LDCEAIENIVAQATTLFPTTTLVLTLTPRRCCMTHKRFEAEKKPVKLITLLFV
jgi:hypothetical protein